MCICKMWCTCICVMWRACMCTCATWRACTCTCATWRACTCTCATWRTCTCTSTTWHECTSTCATWRACTFTCVYMYMCDVMCMYVYMCDVTCVYVYMCDVTCMCQVTVTVPEWDIVFFISKGHHSPAVRFGDWKKILQNIHDLQKKTSIFQDNNNIIINDVNTVEHSYNKPEIPGQTVCYIRAISHEVL